MRQKKKTHTHTHTKRVYFVCALASAVLFMWRPQSNYCLHKKKKKKKEKFLEIVVVCGFIDSLPIYKNLFVFVVLDLV